MNIFDAIYAPFKIKESDFSQRNLMWMKIFGLFAIPGPIAYFLFIRFMDDFIDAPIIMAIISIPMVAMFSCLLQRPVSYLSRTNKNLDEWERGLKNRSESFAYRFIFYSAIILSGFFLLAGFRFGDIAIEMSLMDLGLAMFVFPLAMSTIIANYLAWTVTPFTEELDEEAMMKREKKVKDTILIIAIIFCVLAIFPTLFALGWVNAHNAAGHEGLF